MNEIDKDGVVARLTKIIYTSPPIDPETEAQKIKVEMSLTDVYSELNALVGDVISKDIRAFVENDAKEKSFGQCSTQIITDKSKRTHIHTFIKKHFPLVFNTEADQGKIVIKQANKKTDRRESNSII